MRDYSAAVYTVYHSLREAGHAQLDAAAWLFALGVLVEDIAAAARRYGDKISDRRRMT